MRNIILPLIIGLFIISCSDPLDRPYNKANLREDFKELRKSLSQEDLQRLLYYMTFESIREGDNQVLGKTYRDLLKEAKELEEEIRLMEEEKLLRQSPN